MLLQLDIHNIALIDKVSIELGEGFNVLTGETGAGKSIIIDSINTILGNRVSRDLIRTGKDKALVEAVFKVDYNKLNNVLDSLGIDSEEDGMFYLSREFSTNGKNICRINGKIVPVSSLKGVGSYLIDIHGQYDNQSLLRTDSHMELLDSFGASEIYGLKDEYVLLYQVAKEKSLKLKKICGDKVDRERKIDLLKYQIDEIRKANLKIDEDEELSKERTVLVNAEKIAASLSHTYEVLFRSNTKSSVSDGINEALRELNSIGRLDKKYEDFAKRLEDISYVLEDIVSEIRTVKDEVEYSQERLEQLDDRLDLIYKLKKKYGKTLKDVLIYCESIELELEEMEKSEDTLHELENELEKINIDLFNLSQEINKRRNDAAKILEEKICDELMELSMKGSKFKVKIDFNDLVDETGKYNFKNSGLDDVEFLISPNLGEPLKPLSKIASGGEMSRIMLAIKSILANVDEIPTLIFDEIDIGISGIAAQKVGEKLTGISKSHQVLCVTHLAQIAAMADRHYLIEKHVSEQETKTEVKVLDNAQREDEIARIFGGENITDITKSHAREILLKAKEFKSPK